MAIPAAEGQPDPKSTPVPYFDLSFNVNNSEKSVRELVCRVRPEWKQHPEELKVVKFTDGITNTLLKVSRHRQGASPKEADDSAVLMRAYGNGTDMIIDRDREATSHGLLAARGMAPPLLGRFRNGLLYGFIPGEACKAEDLVKEPIYRGVARKLAEWHARVPITAISSAEPPQDTANGLVNGLVNGHVNGHTACHKENGVNTHAKNIAARRPVPNLWSVLQKWINALSSDTEEERIQKQMLQREMERSFDELDSEDGIGEHGLVFAHCDLLCANVIQLASPDATSAQDIQPVTFIDYEYATPAPAVFDISNHFAEWAGYDCDYSMVPGKSARRKFLQEYVASYSRHSNQQLDDTTVDVLFRDIDRWRGIPGLYWGIWALIQAKISEIDFDYSKYAVQRLGEYFDWRSEVDGSRLEKGQDLPLRERTWAGE